MSDAADPNLAAAPAPKSSGPTPIIPSERLIGDSKELLIDHAGEIYRLRITRSGKLILTK